MFHVSSLRYIGCCVQVEIAVAETAAANTACSDATLLLVYRSFKTSRAVDNSSSSSPLQP
jgi:hypothetical protein